MNLKGTIELEVGAAELALIHTGLQFLVLGNRVPPELRGPARVLLATVNEVALECDILTGEQKRGLASEAQRALQLTAPGHLTI